MARFTELLVVCLGAGACVPVAEQQTGTRLVSGGAALAVPAPGGPAIVGVIERRYSNALEQRIVLQTRAETVGQNRLDVRVLGLARTKGDDALVPTMITEDAIAAEMWSALPGVAMTISPAFVQNAYGPFGYAVGRGAGRDLCLYGWQRIEGEVTTPFVRQGAIETRLRLCQTGADERTLLAGMYGYTVQADFGPGWSTGSPTPALSGAIGATGMPVYPVALSAASAEPVKGSVPRRAPASASPGAESVLASSADAAQEAAAEGPTVMPPIPTPAEPAIIVPAPIVPMPTLSVAAPSAAMATGVVSVMPRVPSPPARVIVPGLSGGSRP